jgi:capsular polysaccharide transport system permease protein
MGEAGSMNTEAKGEAIKLANQRRRRALKKNEANPTPPPEKAQTTNIAQVKPTQPAELQMGANSLAVPKPDPELPKIAVGPVAGPAKMKRRHWGVFFSFFLIVIAPLAAAAFYAYTYAEDQYASVTGFTVRQEDGGAATEILGGLTALGSGGASDGDILYEFIRSHELASIVDAKLDMRGHYAQHWPRDWVFSLWPDASAEDFLWFWQRVVRVAYDSGTGLIEVQARSFDPEFSREITREITRISQDQINALNNQAREDAINYARQDLERAVSSLKSARDALTQFRMRTRIVDPAADIQARMGVMNNLQQQLAASLIEYDLLRGTTSSTDPRLVKAQQRITVIRDRIAIERNTFTSDSTETGAVGEDYPTLIAEFESLTVDREVAEQTYRASISAMEIARVDAMRQSRYLATYVRPSLPQTAQYPQREIVLAFIGLFLILGWSIAILIYYSIRDRG